MPEDPVVLQEGYSVVKGLKNALSATVIPAVVAAVAGLLMDPNFTDWVLAHKGTGALATVVTFGLMFAKNWAKNRNK